MADTEPGILRWRCRRGMKELDLLLTDWLERRWPQAPADLCDAFASLLDEADPDLARWLLGDARPADPQRAAIVDDILRLRR